MATLVGKMADYFELDDNVKMNYIMCAYSMASYLTFIALVNLLKIDAKILSWSKDPKVRKVRCSSVKLVREQHRE